MIIYKKKKTWNTECRLIGVLIDVVFCPPKKCIMDLCYLIMGIFIG